MKKHIYRERVRYIDVDRMNFVHNSKYQVFFEEARTDLVRTENYPYSRIEEEGILFPISEARIFYKEPLTYDDEFTVEVSLEYLKNYSMKFKYTIINSKGNIACTGYTVHASLSKDTLEFTGIPDALRTLLKQYTEKK